MEDLETDTRDTKLLKLVALAAVLVALATAGAFYVVFRQIETLQGRWDCTVRTLVTEEEQCVPMEQAIQVILKDLREIKNP